jgi:hypothetical protein
MPQLPLANLLLSAHFLGMLLFGRHSPTWILAAPQAQQKGGGFIHVTPSPTLPGSNLPAILINGLAQLAIAASAIGIIIGAASWGLGSLSGNYGRVEVGKRMTLYSIVGGLIVGGAATLINWAVGLGQHASPGSFGG